MTEGFETAEAWGDRFKVRAKASVNQLHSLERVVIHFAGGLSTNSTPFSMLPFNPAMAASISFFSLSVVLPRGLKAFSAPEG